jgi:hypothetical protein
MKNITEWSDRAFKMRLTDCVCVMSAITEYMRLSVVSEEQKKRKEKWYHLSPFPSLVMHAKTSVSGWKTLPEV